MRGDTKILQCWVYFEKYKKKSYHTASVFFLRFYCFSFQYSFLWLSFPFFFQLKQQQYMPLIQNKQYSGKSKSFSAFEREYFSIEFEIQSFPVPRTLQHSTVNILQKISTELQPGMTSWSSSDAISRQTSEKNHFTHTWKCENYNFLQFSLMLLLQPGKWKSSSSYDFAIARALETKGKNQKQRYSAGRTNGMR